LNANDPKKDTSSSEAALLFSGGLDSTMAATVLAEQYDKVHLLAVERGYGQVKVERTRRRFEELQEAIGENRFTHDILEARKLFGRIVMRTLLRDIVKYKGLFVVCVGCKLVMHTVALIHCLEHNIPCIADGASGATEWMSDQNSESIEGYRRLHGTFGVLYSNPVIDIQDREEERKRLRELGLSTGRKVAGRDLGTQPVCYYGDLLTFLREAVFRFSLPVTNRSVGAYIEEKTPALIDYVHKHFERLGLNVKERIEGLSSNG